MFVNRKHKKVPRHHLWSKGQLSLSIIPLTVILHHGSRHAATPACHRTRAATIAAATAAVSAATYAACHILLIVACPRNFCCCLPCYLWEDIEISNIEEGCALNSLLIGL
jgi:hypothetical protein